MSEALDPIRANSGADSACAWPGCGLARFTWFRVEPKPGIGEHIAVCQKHRLAAEREPSVALRVWREQSIGKAPRQHIDHVLAGSLLREISRVPGISRERLLAWRRMQLPQRGTVAQLGGPTLDEHDDDTRAALDSLVRDGSVRCRKNALATAYWPVDEDDDASEEIGSWNATASASVPRAPAMPGWTGMTTTATAAGSVAAVPATTPARTPTTTTGSTSPTTSTTGTIGASPSEPSAPQSPITAAATPSEEPSEPATSRLPDDAIAASTAPTAALRAAPVLAAPANPTALKSPSDSEPKVTQADQLLNYVRAHPGESTIEIAAAHFMDPKRCSGSLASLRTGGKLRAERSERKGGPPLMCWWAADAATRTPAGTESPKPKPVANNEQERAFESKLNHWKGRAETAEARAEKAESDYALLENSLVLALRDGSVLAAEKKVWLADESELSDWRCQVETALGFDEDEHVDIGKVTDRIAKLQARQIEEVARRGVLDAVSDVIVFEAEAYAPKEPMGVFDFLRLTLRALKIRLAASEAREQELLDAAPSVPTIDGIPYDAALRLIAEVLDIDTSDGKSPATIYDMARVLQEIGKLRASA